jgi:hypothetical protein
VRVCLLALIALPLAAAAVPVAGAPCPPAGATAEIALTLPTGAGGSDAIVFGTLETAACDDADGALATGYAAQLSCTPSTPAACRTGVAGLRPGHWTHRILVTSGAAASQLQGRRGQLLDRSAGTLFVAWPLYRSVHTVSSLDDALGCLGCLRDALSAAEAAPKPALVQFVPELAGRILLASPLPTLLSGHVTVDGFDTDGIPHMRTIDANGLNSPALRLSGPANRIEGLRLVNVGGNSDTLLIDGPEANDNVLDTVAAVGRALDLCGTIDQLGCIVDGVCHQPSMQFPNGECGDDAIAVRNFAGAAGPNLIRNNDIRGALDKGIKVSDGAVATVERSLIERNADGGLQATLGGSVTAIENISRGNRGTFSANGIAANGAAIGGSEPARLTTQGNLSTDNALRGMSVRALSVALLNDDFTCGNGTAGRGGAGLSIFDGAGQSARAAVHGFAAVHNVIAGATVSDDSGASFGTDAASGANAFAFNGAARSNLRNLTTQPLNAIGNQWEHCGDHVPCDTDAVLALDVSTTGPAAPVAVSPALPTRQHHAPVITAIAPPYAAAGDLVRIYGSGFDAIGGAGTTCERIADANTCRPVRGNCLMIDRQPAEVVAATPTMLVVRAPFTCVAPVPVAARTRWSRGFGRAMFCTAPPAAP